MGWVIHDCFQRYAWPPTPLHDLSTRSSVRPYPWRPPQFDLDTPCTAAVARRHAATHRVHILSRHRSCTFHRVVPGLRSPWAANAAKSELAVGSECTAKSRPNARPNHGRMHGKVRQTSQTGPQVTPMSDSRPSHDQARTSGQVKVSPPGLLPQTNADADDEQHLCRRPLGPGRQPAAAEHVRLRRWRRSPPLND